MGQKLLTQNTELVHLPLLKFHHISSGIDGAVRNTLSSLAYETNIEYEAQRGYY